LSLREFPIRLWILGVLGPTAAAFLFEVAVFLWHGQPLQWEVILGRTGVMLLAALGFSGLMFRLLHERHEALLAERRAQEQIRFTRLLAARTLEAQEEERRRLARDLHDGLGQDLYSLRLQAQLGRPVVEQCSALMEEIQRLATSLYPAALERLGLVAGLRSYLDKFWRDRVRLEVSEDFPRLAPAAEAAIFRLVQEAVGNALRHGQAASVLVRLGRESGGLVVEVTDNGCGFEPTAIPRRGLGLMSMQERAESLGGTLQVESAAQRGTRVRALLPASLAPEPRQAEHSA
jgi:two-component system sensor histidine kinase NreB